MSDEKLYDLFFSIIDNVLQYCDELLLSDAYEELILVFDDVWEQRPAISKSRPILKALIERMEKEDRNKEELFLKDSYEESLMEDNIDWDDQDREGF